MKNIMLIDVESSIVNISEYFVTIFPYHINIPTINFRESSYLFLLLILLMCLSFLEFIVVNFQMRLDEITLRFFKNETEENVLTINPISNNEGANQFDSEFLNDITEVIDRNISREILNAEFLSKELNLTQRTLLRRIKKYTGLTTIGFIREYRIEQAAMLFVKKDSTITEIMNAVGYNSLSYFCSEFKKRYDMSPSEFREKFKEMKPTQG